jgi:hypothetical protein
VIQGNLKTNTQSDDAHDGQTGGVLCTEDEGYSTDPGRHPGAEGLEGLIFTYDGSIQRRPVSPLLAAAILSCELLSIPAAGVSICSQTTAISQIPHDMQGQYSRVTMPFRWS